MGQLNSTPRIVLTGGPCAGKTTALNYLREALLDIGYYPIMVPEAATLLNQCGINPNGGIFNMLSFEKLVIEQMLAFEQLVQSALHHAAHKKPVVIYDRGLMDIKAYVDNTAFEALQEQYGIDTVDMRDKSYTAIFHLRTAALGAEDFYTQINNHARVETLEEARLLDERTLEAWIGHSHLSIIDNSTDFSGKLRRLFGGVCAVLGVPSPLEIERKFLVNNFNRSQFALVGINVSEVEIEQFYIIPPPDEKKDVVVRFRKRTQYGSSIYWKTQKEHIESGTNIEIESEVSPDEYEWSKAYKNPSTVFITKNRLCFVYKNQYFELDVFDGTNKGLSILEIELLARDQEVSLPPFLYIGDEVTDDKNFSNRALAQIR
ncbi:MAG: AAA family ATPase [bacterium]|nr:AAA family ATPase [bacterium]